MPLPIKPGDQFGRLTVVRQVTGYQATHWLCVCECNQTRTVLCSALRNGAIYACVKCAELDREYAAEIAAAKERAAELGRHAVDPETLPQRPHFEFEGNEDALYAEQENFGDATDVQ